MQQDRIMAYNIDKQKIINYLKENKIFFQKTDELIETIDELQSQTHNGLITLVKNSSINVMVKREDMLDSGFAELAE